MTKEERTALATSIRLGEKVYWACSGDTWGYYFWTNAHGLFAHLSDVNDSYRLIDMAPVPAGIKNLPLSGELFDYHHGYSALLKLLDE